MIDRSAKRVQQCGVLLTLVAMMALSIAFGAGLFPATAQAATPSYPACQASQITVTAGATSKNSHYPVRTSIGVRNSLAYELVPVYFYNRSSTCHLLMGAPSVRAVRNTTDADPAGISPSDLSTPAGADNTRRLVVGRRKKLEALFVVVNPLGPSFKGCDPATATGFLIGGYASPVATTDFVVRQLGKVCFDTGVGLSVLDYGIDWPSLQ